MARFCDKATPCEYAAFPEQTFCDLDGTVAGTKNTCIEPPEIDCEVTATCTNPDTPICDASRKVCRGCSETDGDRECVERDAEAPFCVAGRCVPCAASRDCDDAKPICSDTTNMCTLCTSDARGNVACATRDLMRPICNTDGVCVECRDTMDCPGERPVCELGTGSCVKCRQHEQCESEVCNDTGTCEPEGDIIYVDRSVGADSGACGSKANPCGTIGLLEGGLAKLTGARTTIKVRMGVYLESVIVDGGQTVRFVGPATVSPPLNTPGFFVRNGSDVSFDAMNIQDAAGNADADGLRCENFGSALRLRQCQVTANAAGGIQATDCTVAIDSSVVGDNQGIGVSVASSELTVEASRIHRNRGGGLSIRDTEFVIRNNFVVSNGDALGTNFGGVKIDNSGAFTNQVFEFNTVARNASLAAADSSGVECSASGIIVLPNNIVFGGVGAPAVKTLNCSWAYSNVEGGASGIGNLDVDPKFVAPLSGDFHLAEDSPCRNLADPVAEVPVDIDGDARPQGQRSDIGADEIVE